MEVTVTLDPDVRLRLVDMARERNVSFEDVLNSTLRAGLDVESPRARRFKVKARPLGARPVGARPGINLDRALRLADHLEDEAVVHKLQLET